MVMDGSNEKERRTSTLPSMNLTTTTSKFNRVAPVINTRVGPRPKTLLPNFSQKRKLPFNEVIQFLPIHISKLDPIWEKQLDKWKSSAKPNQDAFKVFLKNYQIQREKVGFINFMETAPQRLEKIREQMRQPIANINTNVNSQIDKLKHFSDTLFSRFLKK